MEEHQEKMQSFEEVLISAERIIKLEPEEPDCLPQSHDTDEGTQVKPFEEILFSGTEDHAVKSEPEDDPLDCVLQNDKTEGAAGNSATSHQGRIYRKYICKECDVGYVNPEMLTWHIRYCHGTDAVVKTSKHNRNRYRCKLCKTERMNIGSIIEHLYSKHKFSDLPFKCNHCSKSFFALNKLKKHQDTCTVKKSDPLRCDECETKYSHPEIFAWHIENCHGTDAVVKVVKSTCKKYQSYQCLSCEDDMFNGLYNVMVHLRTKHNELLKYPFSCYACNRQFLRKLTLKTHLTRCKKIKLLKNRKVK